MSGLVSVIIPTYNRERFIPYALESVKNQTYKNWELIIVDDGSTDNTCEICRKFAKNVRQPVKYIYQENKGVSGARNTGLKAAEGDFVAFLDSDDRWYPWHLKKCLDFFRIDKSLDFVFTAGRKINFFTGKILIRHNFYVNNKPHPILSPKIFSKRGKMYFLKNSPLLKVLIIEHGLPSGLQCTVFKRESIEGHYFPSELKIAEDRYFIYKLILNDKKAAFSLAISTARFVHNDHVSGEIVDSPQKLEFIANNLIKAYKLLFPYTSSLSEKRIINKKLVEFYIWYLLPALLQQKKRFSAFHAIFRALCCYPFDFAIYKSIIKLLMR